MQIGSERVTVIGRVRHRRGAVHFISARKPGFLADRARGDFSGADNWGRDGR